MINEEIIKSYLSVPANITLYKTTDSTNTRLKEEAQNALSPYRVIIADNQTKGRGRLGRQFHSPQQSGIYMSLLVSPKEFKDIGLLTAFTAVSVCNALEEASDDTFEIKWVNDILKNGKKICGILAEAGVENEELKYIIVGIGINVYAPDNDFPSEIKNIAGSVFDCCNPDKASNPIHDSQPTAATSIQTLTHGYNDKRNRIISEIINNFYTFNHDFISEYKKRSCIIGKNILVHQGDDIKKAKALDINNNCHLLVEYENGKTELLSFGEISVRLN